MDNCSLVNDYKVTDSWFENLDLFLASFKNLQGIGLNNMRIGEKVEFFKNSLKKVSKVKWESNGVDSATGKILLSHMDLPRLEVLHLGSNWIGTDGLYDFRNE